MTDASNDLHHVTREELPALFKYLERHLPHSWTLYATVRESAEGRWTDNSRFYTLGWPDIRAVGLGEPYSTSRVYNYHTKPRTTCVFSPVLQDSRALLTHPGFIDWTQNCMFQATPTELGETIVSLSREHGSRDVMPIRHVCTCMIAQPGDVELRPTPEDVTVRRLTSSDAAFVSENWTHRRAGSDDYVRELVQRFPSVGVFDRDGGCLGYEVGTEYGTMGMLYVKPEARGQGLGSVITTHLAHSYFLDGLPAVVNILAKNLGSVQLHERLGFKPMCGLDLILHVPADKFTGDIFGM
ncbi:uncharacterized protein LOC101854005 [Aplysia californica]|uniref:Glycine N-acyltransferase-like protein n=1 Tax=Aplysia californica TaxID=6500 RepID=A0ABM0ZV92_APLCA|nr:uncharacterized protein LOC101854005 [Aplysia californica]